MARIQLGERWSRLIELEGFPKIRYEILEHMIDISERMDQYYGWRILNGDKAESFKPTIADRLLFKKILDEREEDLRKVSLDKIRPLECAFYLMAYVYLPKYRDFK